jgi:1-deoxyxylulose-5-phosphate synthase
LALAALLFPVNLIDMQLRELGKTGIKVSEVAFGGVEIGLPYGIGINHAEDMLSRPAAIDLLHEAIDNGINFFDTARLYGESEAIMGEAFRDRRHQVVIATKCKHFKDGDGKIPAYRQLKDIIEGSLNESLTLLKTDYVDVFMLHQADLSILDNEDVKAIFDELKDSGKIRSTGASTYSVVETHTAIERDWDVIQHPFNMLDQGQAENFAYADEKGTGLVVRSVLMKGLLSDRGKNLHPALGAVEQHIAGYYKLLDNEITELPELATKFALSFPEISAVLVGIDKPAYLHKAIEAVSGTQLSPEIKAKAMAMTYPDPAFLDLPTWDRKGWLT